MSVKNMAANVLRRMGRAEKHPLYDTTLFGTRTTQLWADLQLWEQALNALPDVRCVIELGTYFGGMSTYLLLQCLARSKQFYSFDVHLPSSRNGMTEWIELDRHLIEEDIFESPTLRKLLGADYHHPLLLYCDDGDKREEFATFFPLLRVGDVIAVHDWGTEFTATDAREYRGYMRPLFASECERAHSLTRWWVVT